MSKTNRIFLDLDESLIASVYTNSKENHQQYLDWYPEFEHIDIICSDGIYLSFLRPITLELIKECEKLVGDEVYILTAAVLEYANQVNEKFGFGIDKNKVFAREDWAYHATVPKFADSNNILIDNEDYFYHTRGSCNKKNFIHLEHDNLIEIEDFILYQKEEFFRENDEAEYQKVLTNLKSRVL